MPQAHEVRSLFSSIAHRYDRMNHLLSGGVDYYWRKRLTECVKALKPQKVLDLATGSGDVALALKAKLAPSTQIIGVDFCEAMLDHARAKALKKGMELSFVCADCLELPFETGSIDVATLAFGIRNFENRHKGLAEIKRILKPKGSLFILEFSQPDAWLRPFYYLYLKTLLPLIAHLGTGRKGAYQYLANSIEGFPSKEGLSKEILSAGFAHVSAVGLTGSLVAIHRCDAGPL